MASETTCPGVREIGPALLIRNGRKAEPFADQTVHRGDADACKHVRRHRRAIRREFLVRFVLNAGAFGVGDQRASAIDQLGIERQEALDNALTRLAPDPA